MRAGLALRTQQVIAYESGAADTVDPLGGSWFVEKLTDDMEAKILAIMAEVVTERRAGTGRPMREIAREREAAMAAGGG